VNINDPHEYYWNYYSQKAQERLKAGDQRGATMLNAQAQQHAIMMKQGGGAGSPDAPEELGDLEATQGAAMGGLPGQRTIAKV
jgi:hypothetical protein